MVSENVEPSGSPSVLLEAGVPAGTGRTPGVPRNLRRTGLVALVTAVVAVSTVAVSRPASAVVIFDSVCTITLEATYNGLKNDPVNGFITLSTPTLGSCVSDTEPYSAQISITGTLWENPDLPMDCSRLPHARGNTLTVDVKIEDEWISWHFVTGIARGAEGVVAFQLEDFGGGPTVVGGGPLQQTPNALDLCAADPNIATVEWSGVIAFADPAF